MKQNVGSTAITPKLAKGNFTANNSTRIVTVPVKPFGSDLVTKKNVFNLGTTNKIGVTVTSTDDRVKIELLNNNTNNFNQTTQNNLNKTNTHHSNITSPNLIELSLENDTVKNNSFALELYKPDPKKGQQDLVTKLLDLPPLETNTQQNITKALKNITTALIPRMPPFLIKNLTGRSNLKSNQSKNYSNQSENATLVPIIPEPENFIPITKKTLIDKLFDMNATIGLIYNDTIALIPAIPLTKKDLVDVLLHMNGSIGALNDPKENGTLALIPAMSKNTTNLFQLLLESVQGTIRSLEAQNNVEKPCHSREDEIKNYALLECVKDYEKLPRAEQELFLDKALAIYRSYPKPMSPPDSTLDYQPTLSLLDVFVNITYGLTTHLYLDLQNEFSHIFNWLIESGACVQIYVAANSTKQQLAARYKNSGKPQEFQASSKYDLNFISPIPNSPLNNFKKKFDALLNYTSYTLTTSKSVKYITYSFDHIRHTGIVPKDRTAVLAEPKNKTDNFIDQTVNCASFLGTTTGALITVDVLWNGFRKTLNDRAREGFGSMLHSMTDIVVNSTMAFLFKKK